MTSPGRPTPKEFARSSSHPRLGLEEASLPTDRDHGLGDDWTVIERVQISGPLGEISAAVSTRGVLVIARINNDKPVTLVRSIPYCGQRSLEPVITQLLRATRTLTEMLRGPLGGRSAAHPVLIVSGATVPFQHLDVLVTAERALAEAASAYPQTLSQLDISAVLRSLRSANGEIVPQRWPDTAPFRFGDQE
jgi:hypothetical protein